MVIHIIVKMFVSPCIYIYMGYTNGASNSRNDSERGGKDEKGDGFTLTADKHYHLQNKKNALMYQCLLMTVMQLPKNL